MPRWQNSGRSSSAAFIISRLTSKQGSANLCSTGLGGGGGGGGGQSRENCKEVAKVAHLIFSGEWGNVDPILAEIPREILPANVVYYDLAKSPEKYVKSTRRRLHVSLSAIKTFLGTAYTVLEMLEKGVEWRKSFGDDRKAFQQCSVGGAVPNQSSEGKEQDLLFSP